MRATLILACISVLGVIVAGCDTSLEGQYKPYEAATPQAELWPVPDSADSQQAAYHEAPLSAPTTMPVDAGG